jgi:hypothetical protein
VFSLVTVLSLVAYPVTLATPAFTAPPNHPKREMAMSLSLMADSSSRCFSSCAFICFMNLGLTFGFFFHGLLPEGDLAVDDPWL